MGVEEVVNNHGTAETIAILGHCSEVQLKMHGIVNATNYGESDTRRYQLAVLF